jgi:hypothetical protein
MSILFEKPMSQRHLFLVLVCCLVNAAWAGMDLVGETKESIIYINLDAAETRDSVVKADGSQDFHRQQRLGDLVYLSSKFVNEYDCAKKQVRQLALSIYPENMANGGELLNDTQAKDWLTPGAGSALSMLLLKACQTLQK